MAFEKVIPLLILAHLYLCSIPSTVDYYSWQREGMNNIPLSLIISVHISDPYFTLQ